MKLRRLAYLGTFLTPVLFGCSDDATVLSVNINLSSDKLDRSNPAAWSAITVSVAGKPLPMAIPIQTEVVDVQMNDANGMPLPPMKVTQVKGRWFQRIDMPGGYQDGGAVTASATGAYKQTTKVGGMDMTTVIANYAFSTEKKAGDKEPTINVDPDAAVIEEVSALFLNFNAPEPAPPPAAGGSGGGGAPAATGGVATGGSPAATGGSPAATGGSPAATGGSPAATGGSPAATGGAAPMSQGGGGATGGGGKASDAGGKAAGGNGGTTSSSGGGGSGGGGAGGTSAGSKS